MAHCPSSFLIVVVQLAWINKRPTTSIAAQVTPCMENARDFDPPEPRMIDMSPKGMTASTSRVMPTNRLSAVSIIVSTINPATTSRIPLGRSQARVSASDAGGLRPNVPEIRSGDTRYDQPGGQRNKAAALKAMEIDDTVSEAHAQLGYATMFYDHDWPLAEKEFRRALELNPSNANAHRGLAQYFVSNARFDDAPAEIEWARELDPVSLSISSDQGWFLHFARKPDEAIAHLRRTLRIDPNFGVAHVMLGNAYELKN